MSNAKPIIVVVAGALLLSGCVSEGTEGYDPFSFAPRAITVTLPDGGKVVCVTATSDGSIDCDWDRATHD